MDHKGQRDMRGHLGTMSPTLLGDDRDSSLKGCPDVPKVQIVSTGATTRAGQVKAALSSDPTLSWLPARLRKIFGPGVRLTYLETSSYRDGTPPAMPTADLFTEYRR